MMILAGSLIGGDTPRKKPKLLQSKSLPACQKKQMEAKQNSI
jgi:ribosome biogenesis SPOUT family RNA methylase Rps3